MDLGIKGKVAVVTAASRGLGRAVAEALAREGVDLVICSRSESDISKTGHAIQKTYNVKVISSVCDVRKKSDILKLKDVVDSSFGTCHILFTSAGGPPSGKLMNFSTKDLQAAIDLNLMSVANLIYTFIPYMQKQKWGRILALTSSNVRHLLPQFPLSNVSRNSIVAFIKTLAYESAHLNITANMLAPGLFLTDPTKNDIKRNAKENSISYNEMLNTVSKTMPAKKIGDPDDFGSLAAYLSSNQASYITGETFLIDGGVDSLVM